MRTFDRQSTPAEIEFAFSQMMEGLDHLSHAFRYLAGRHDKTIGLAQAEIDAIGIIYHSHTELLNEAADLL